ncbi:MAG: hypothetical protein OXG44_11140 [Gammaproteobacteria bacterium]|nr:hypothetical protein [Gammaproteobacteria bacterium]
MTIAQIPFPSAPRRGSPHAVVAVCADVEDGRAPYLRRLAGVTAISLRNGEIRHFGNARRFWRWMHALDATVLMVGDSRRDMSLLDPPPSDLFRRLKRLPQMWILNRRGAPPSARRLTIWGVDGNHPAGLWTCELTIVEVGLWAQSHLDLLDRCDLGAPQPTFALQAVTSLRRMQCTGPDILTWHTSEPLQRWERLASRSFPISRISDYDDFHLYPEVHYADFRAFYVTIMAEESMPRRVKGFGGIDGRPLRLEQLRRRVADGQLAMLRLTDGGYVTGDMWGGEPVDSWVAYEPSRLLNAWAERMLEIRASENAPEVKVIANSLWGKLQEVNRDTEPVARSDVAGLRADAATIWGRLGIALPVVREIDGRVVTVTPDGQTTSDPLAFRPRRNIAVGMFVRCHAERRMSNLRSRTAGPVLHTHTDSLYSLAPIDTTGLKAETAVKRNVLWQGGQRFEDGRLAAAPGIPQGNVSYAAGPWPGSAYRFGGD